MTKEKTQEYTRRISQANPTDMVVVIYDIALGYAKDARVAISGKDSGSLNMAVVNIRRCINELIASLDYNYSPAGELLMLYTYCSRRLSTVSTEKDETALAEVENIISGLRDAYAEIAEKNTSGAVMENTQSVYAGLTYGRGVLNEEIVGSDNRGFLV